MREWSNFFVNEKNCLVPFLLPLPRTFLSSFSITWHFLFRLSMSLWLRESSTRISAQLSATRRLISSVAALARISMTDNSCSWKVYWAILCFSNVTLNAITSRYAHFIKHSRCEININYNISLDEPLNARFKHTQAFYFRLYPHVTTVNI